MTTLRSRRAHRNVFSSLQLLKADALTGFIAGFLVGIMGMYVYVVIIGSL